MHKNASISIAQADVVADGWRDHIKSELEPNWRSTEWDETNSKFTPDVLNPYTAISNCPVLKCNGLTVVSKLCVTCNRAFKKTAKTVETFIATYEPPRPNRPIDEAPEQCRATIDGTRCSRQSIVRGSCHTHYSQWTKYKKTAEEAVTLEHFLGTLCKYMPPTQELPKCAIEDCAGEVICKALCRRHYGAYLRSKSKNAEEFIRNYAPAHRTGEFDMLGIGEPLRSEILFALQVRDRENRNLYPTIVRAFIAACAPHATLAYLDDHAREEIVTAQKNENYVSFSRDALRIIANEHIAAMGLDPLEVEVIDTTQLGLIFLDAGEKVRQNGAHQLDLRSISQPWIRTVYREWLREKIETQEPVRATDLSEMLFAARVGSESLSNREDNGVQPSSLGLADMRATVQTFAELKKGNGELYTHQARRQRLARFKGLIEFGRSRGHLPALHNGFADGPGLSIPIDEAIEEEKGRFIPETVIRKLDDNLSAFNSSARPGADVCPEVYSELLRTVYQLLRDTGRRPAEIYGLRYDCLRLEGETSVLIWDNKKGRRYNRRLPILPSTAKTIASWKEFRKENEPDWWTDDFLFPPLYKDTSFLHLQSNNFTPCFNEWTKNIELADADLRDANGVAIIFSRRNLRPYGFRHSYAQRLVDAGVPIETVRELMDHKSISTTQVYFKVRDDSKRRAMETAARYTVDRYGSQVKASSSGYVLESVAIPYGRCVNPSNVKAGGHNCPVRFQCTGCPDFRSDPSYLPQLKIALQEKLGDLLEAEELGADNWVIDATSAEVEAYRRVVRTLEDVMENLGDRDREALNAANDVLHGTSGLDLIPIEVISNGKKVD